MRSFLPILTFAILLSSCAGGLRIEKRHYRNGFYISSGKSKGVEKQYADTARVEDINRDWVLWDSDEPYPFTVARDSIAERSDSTKNGPEESSPELYPEPGAEQSPADTIKNQARERKFLKYDGPEEARWATILHWIGWPMVMAGLLAFILFLIVPGSLPLLGAFTLLFTLGAILETIVLIKSIFASNKYQSQPTIADQFNKLERQITRTALVIGGIYILYVATVLVLFMTGAI